MRAYAVPSTQALRGWQRRAMVRILLSGQPTSWPSRRPARARPRSRCASRRELLADGRWTRITVVAPTEHLKTSGRRPPRGVGIALDPEFSNSSAQQLRRVPRRRGHLRAGGQRTLRHRVRTENRRTLVVLDEIHHAGDAKSWGDAIREAFGDATRRLALTGTPFRSDDSPIPFVIYERGPDGLERSQPTTPTATPRRSPTASCGRWSSSPTPVRRAGATARARNTPPGSANR